MATDVRQVRQSVENAVAAATDFHSASVGTDGDVVTLEVCEHGASLAQRLGAEFWPRLRVTVLLPGHEWRRVR